jgi:hypothetical protein
MYLFTVFLPLKDNRGRPHPGKLLKRVQAELTEKFGGITAHTRSPAKGAWKTKGKTQEDDILILEVMSEKRFTSWWISYRRTLEARFKQREVLIRREIVRIIPSE